VSKNGFNKNKPKNVLQMRHRVFN